MIYDPATEKFTKLTPEAFDLRTVRTITEDQQSNLWFGTQHGLIIKYDISTKRFTRYSEPFILRNSLTVTFTSCMLTGTTICGRALVERVYLK
jgi:ligand-binding sensor domain-containing protein